MIPGSAFRCKQLNKGFCWFYWVQTFIIRVFQVLDKISLRNSKTRWLDVFARSLAGAAVSQDLVYLEALST